LIYYTADADTRLSAFENIADRSLLRVLSSGESERVITNQIASWDDRRQFTAPVGSLQPNPFGLYDMLGNVAEWTADGFDSDRYYKMKVLNSTVITDTKGFKVFRGGSCFLGPANARCSARHKFDSHDRWCHIGFRIVAIPQ
jgi:formylglycine-generating enzyme required for sulfatase activity